MNLFVYKAVFNWGKENLCPLDLKEYLEYERQELGSRGLRQCDSGKIIFKHT